MGCVLHCSNIDSMGERTDVNQFFWRSALNATEDEAECLDGKALPPLFRGKPGLLLTLTGAQGEEFRRTSAVQQNHRRQMSVFGAHNLPKTGATA
jgi:hypothetical protein